MELFPITYDMAVDLDKLGFPFKKVPRSRKYEAYCYELGASYSPEYANVVEVVSIELVAKWLRIEKNIEVLPFYIISNNVYEDRCRIIGQGGFMTSGKVYSDYEEALCVGVERAIEILKEQK